MTESSDNLPKIHSVVTNICGPRNGRAPLQIDWTAVYDSAYSGSTTTIVNWRQSTLSTSALDKLFFEYFGPLEHWCEHNLSGNFALWFDRKSIYLLLIHEHDHLYFKLMFNGQMPDLKMLNGWSKTLASAVGQ
jgi:hypothetical protein